MLTGYTTNLPTDLALNAGVLMRTISAVSTKLGVTRGAPDFDPGVDISDVQFDGMRMRLKGLSRKTGWKPVIKGTLIELGPAASGKQTLVLEPGSTEATVGGVTTTTPKAAGAMFAANDYVTDLRWIFERGNGLLRDLLPGRALHEVVAQGQRQDRGRDLVRVRMRRRSRERPGPVPVPARAPHGAAGITLTL
jgi:hypothetical protein